MDRSKYVSALRSLGLSVVCAASALTHAPGASAAARTLFVTNDGADVAGCGDRGAPCRSIGQAIQNAADGDAVAVGAGEYGDLNGDGIFNGPGEEHANTTLGCIVCITKSLRVLSLHGARVTTIDGSKASSRNFSVIVGIHANHVTFGAVDAGFTLAESLVDGLAAAEPWHDIRVSGNVALKNGQEGFIFINVRGLLVADNVALDNPIGFSMGGGPDFLAPIFQRNLASGNSIGFAVNANGAQVLSNIALHNGTGIQVAGNAMVINGNTVSNNYIAGLAISGLLNGGESVKSLRGNSMVGNLGPGLTLGLPVEAFTGNNFYGNDTNSTRFTQDPGARCALVNVTRMTVRATNNFWGRLGPNQPAAGDFVGGVCDQLGTTLFVPFVTQGFAITK